MHPDASRSERNILSNQLLAIIDDKNIVMADTKSFTADIRKNMKLLDFFNYVTSIICFVLGAFQLLMTIQANIQDSLWELGVLRSMGCTRI
jgi:hypothetical protein